jgi:cytochrome b subunit of formate dehydrogenase
MRPQQLRRPIGWLLLVLSILLVITGLGITEWRTVEAASFGLLPKSLAFQLHSLLWIPFIAVLAAHLLLSCRLGRRGKD